MSQQFSRKKGIDVNALYHKNLHREFVADMLKKPGDFLLRPGSDGGKVLSVNVAQQIVHFKFSPKDKTFMLESRSFTSLEELINSHFKSQATLTRATGAKLMTPIYNTIAVIEKDKIKFMKELGRGNFGEVWLAMLLPENEVVAVKILGGNSTEKDRTECLAEAKLMAALNHPNVVKLKGLSFWKKGGESGPPQLLIVLEFCEYGSLDKLLESNAIENRGKIRALLDSAMGMEYLHKGDIIHRDIASRNCLVQLKDGKFIVKIADFGLSRLAPDHYALATKRRLPIFSMPEESLKAREWTAMSDVWSFGILIHEVYNKGKNPYEVYFLEHKMGIAEIVTQFKAGFRLPMPTDMPKEIQTLTSKCLSTVNERPTMKDVAAFLKNYYVGLHLP